MPEGDTIFRAARTLHRALAGKVVTRFETQYAQIARVHDDAPITGRRVEKVEARGKHLLMYFSATANREPGTASLPSPAGSETERESARGRAGAAVVLVGTAGALYAMSDTTTRQRVLDGFSEARDLDGAVNMSVPLRYTMAVNTLHIIAEQPWLGVGAGDFVTAYEEMNARRSPAWNAPRNPHNQLLFTMATTGVLGGVLLLAVWFAPPWLHRRKQDGLGPLRIALPVFFFTICLAESYLWRSNTALMFALFSALLYGPIGEPKRPPDPGAGTD